MSYYKIHKLNDNERVNSGEQLVEKGATKHDASLPSVGLKDVVPSGSWLERKQVQAALEGRRHLLEVQRIEKCGAVSLAHWDMGRGLAAVVRQAGPHWQYYGHHEDGQLYLWPEEALFLMETNCLQLTVNEVTVSLQQAYALLLRGTVDIVQYQVYAALGRLGYKVFRHQAPCPPCPPCQGPDGDAADNTKSDSGCQHYKSETKMDLDLNHKNVEVSNIQVENSDAGPEVTDAEEIEAEAPSRKKQKLQMFKERKYLYRTGVVDIFGNIPEMCRKVTVTVGVPEQNLIPRNVFPNQVEYKIDLDRVKLKSAASPPPAAPLLSTSSVGDASLMKIEQPPAPAPARARARARAPPTGHSLSWSARFPPQRFPSAPPQGFWGFGRPRLAVMYNMLLQRPLLLQHYAAPPPPPPPPRRPHHHHQHAQLVHLQSIRALGARLRRLAAGGAPGAGVQALRSLLKTYNQRFGTSLGLSPDYELVEGAAPPTIELDDDEPRAKRPRRSDGSYEQRFSELEELARALRALGAAGRLFARHRRALGALLREFNAAYGAAATLDPQLLLVDRNLVVLDSDDDSDCQIESSETPAPPAPIASKKLLNPFSVLRQQQKSESKPGTSAAGANTSTDDAVSFRSWLPTLDDFGRRELVSKAEARDLFVDTEKTNHIFDFLKQYSFYRDFKNWNQVKSVFWESIEERVGPCPPPQGEGRAAGAALVVAAWRGGLGAGGGGLRVHFDVYNRDVLNFKKSNKPKPHFRICCVSEASGLPSGAALAALAARGLDGVPLALALGGPGAGATYLQVGPQETPAYRGREE